MHKRNDKKMEVWNGKDKLTEGKRLYWKHEYEGFAEFQKLKLNFFEQFVFEEKNGLGAYAEHNVVSGKLIEVMKNKDDVISVFSELVSLGVYLHATKKISINIVSGRDHVPKKEDDSKVNYVG